MQDAAPPRKPLLPSLAMAMGLIAFAVGLVMLLLKIGGASLLNVHVAQLDVTTTSDALAVMVIGAAMTLGIFFISAWVDVQWRKTGDASKSLYTSSVLRSPPKRDDPS